MNLYDPLNPAVTANPYPYYVGMRESEPVKWIPSLQGFAVSRWDDVMAVLSDPKMYSSANFWPALLGEFDPVPEDPPMISLDPPAHLRTRKLSSKAFVPSRVALMQQQVTRIATVILDEILKKHGREGEFDFVKEFSALYPATVISEILGVDVERRGEFKRWVDDLLSAGNRASYPPERLAQLENSSKSIRKYFDELYDRRSAKPGDDMMSGFIFAEVDGVRLTRLEVLNMGVLLLLGGIETTTNLLGITCVTFKRQPGIFETLRANRGKIPMFVEEVLRHDTPVQMLFRHTTADTTLAGAAIPKGSLVLLMLGSSNRDERKFENADKFLLDRNPKEIMSFGQGPHYCLGQYLSRLEVKTAIELWLDRFEYIEPLSDEVKWLDAYFARGPKTLPVRFKTK